MELLSACIAGYYEEGLNRGTTALINAARVGNVPVMKLLLDHDAGIDTAKADGATALYIAAQENHLEAVELLLDRGACVNTPELNLWTPLFAAVYRGDARMTELLMERGAYVNQLDVGGGSVLTYAAYKGHVKVARQLLARGADHGVHKMPPLVVSAQEGHLEMTEILLDAGADVNQYRMDGLAFPLFSSVKNGHVAIAKLLLKNGADPNQATVERGTPLKMALMRNDIELVKLLLVYGADCFEVNQGYVSRRSSDIAFLVNSSIYVKDAAIDGRIAYFQACVDVGEFPAPFAQWFSFIPSAPFDELRAWACARIKDERACFEAFHQGSASTIQGLREFDDLRRLVSSYLVPSPASRRSARELLGREPDRWIEKV